VHIIGNIEGATGFGTSQVFCKWSLVVGAGPSSENKWRCVDGATTGRTWTAGRELEDDMASFDHPIQVRFNHARLLASVYHYLHCTTKHNTHSSSSFPPFFPFQVRFDTTSLSGWPRLLLEVYTVDDYGRVDVAGYGMTFVPSSPGERSKVVPMSRPRGSFWDGVSTYFVGGAPRYVQLRMSLSSIITCLPCMSLSSIITCLPCLCYQTLTFHSFPSFPSLPFLSLLYLSFPFFTFPFPSLPFLSLLYLSLLYLSFPYQVPASRRCAQRRESIRTPCRFDGQRSHHTRCRAK
jgi:B9 domain-containing protein 2